MLRMTVQRKIGKRAYHFQFEGKNLYDVVHESEKLSFADVAKCGLCGSDNIVLGTRHPQNKFKYTFVRCQECRAQLIFGQTKEDADTFYLRRREDKSLDWHVYEPEESEAAEAAAEEAKRAAVAPRRAVKAAA